MSLQGAPGPSGHYGELLAVTDVAVITTDMEGRVTYWNRGCETHTGWATHEVIGRRVLDVVAGPDERDAIDAVLKEVGEQGSWLGVVAVRRRDGSRLPVRAHVKLVHDGTGRDEGFAAICVDVSDQVATERRLRSATDCLQAIGDTLDDGLLIFDDAGRLTSLNPAAEDMLGIRREDLGRSTHHDAIHAECAGGRRFATCPILHPAAAEARVPDDLFWRADGGMLRVSYSARGFREEDGRRGAVVIVRARTEDTQRAPEPAGGRAQRRPELLRRPVIAPSSGAVAFEELEPQLSEGGAVLEPSEAVGLDRWVLHRAMTRAADGRAVVLRLSAASVAATGSLRAVAQSLATWQVHPMLLIVDLPTAAVRDNEQATERLGQGLLGLGCRTSLTCERASDARPWVDYLRIDMHGSVAWDEIEALVGAARALGRQTIAAGVRDQAGLMRLAAIGVDYALGPAVSEPVPFCEGSGSSA